MSRTRKFAFARKSFDASHHRFVKDLIRAPQAFAWDNDDRIILQLCPVAMRLAQRTNWSLIRQAWWLQWGVPPTCELTLEAIPCP